MWYELKELTLNCTHVGRSRFLKSSSCSDTSWEQGSVSVSSSVGQSAWRAEELYRKLLKCKLEMPLQEMYLQVFVFGSF